MKNQCRRHERGEIEEDGSSQRSERTNGGGDIDRSAPRPLLACPEKQRDSAPPLLFLARRCLGLRDREEDRLVRVVEGSREGKAIICIYHNPGGGRRGETGHASALFVLLALTPLSPHSFYCPHFPSPPSPFGGGGGGINLSAKSSRRPKGKKVGGGGEKRKERSAFLPSFLLESRFS